MATANFKIDTAQYLGQLYGLYRDEAFSLAIGNPSSYFQYRKRVVDYVKTKAIKNLYDVIYNVLVNGDETDANGTPANKPFGDDFNLSIPNVPEARVNEIALSAAKTLDRILDEVLDLVCPLDYHTIASKRLEMKGEAGVK